jgi:glycine cleavage system H protein
MPHDYLTMHAAKTIEYLVAVAYLLLFVPFWRFVNRRQPASEAASARLQKAAPNDWFTVPNGRFYHPGHSWVSLDGSDVVTVGLDEFASRLVGPPSAIDLPEVGAALAQGEPAWSLVADGRKVPMLSPVDGTVVAVNDMARLQPAVAHGRPYDGGWLLKVRSPRISANLRQLFSGQLAHQWMKAASEELRMKVAPDLGLVYEDGGALVDGVARVIDPHGWDDMARRFFLTANGGHHAAFE